MTNTFVIIGGDAAGMSAGSKAKRDDPQLDVIVFEKDQWVSYGACGLPYYVKGQIQSLDDLVSITPEEFRQEHDIDLHTDHEVTAIDAEAKTITVENKVDEVFEQSYDHLLIATGAQAILPDIPGTSLAGVFTLDSLAAGKELREYLGQLRSRVAGFEDPRGGDACTYVCTQHPASIAIVGGGFIGVETAEAFDAHDLDVHLFQRSERVLTDFGEDVARVVESHLEDRGVMLHLGAAVEQLGEIDNGRLAVDTDTENVPVDMVLLGAGVRPNTELAVDADIGLGETGAIATNEYGRTDAENIYAAGDCAEIKGVLTGEPVYIPLALTANRHGRAIGQTIVGEPTLVGPVAGTAALKAFDLEVARTGVIDHEQAREYGLEPVPNMIETAFSVQLWSVKKALLTGLTRL